MKKLLFLTCYAFVTSFAFSFDKVDKVANFPSSIHYLEHLNIACKDKIDLEYFLGDTITLKYAQRRGLRLSSDWCETEQEKELSAKAFSLVTPDTIWIKQSKKPKEGKHFIVLHQYKATYNTSGKKLFINDITQLDSIIDNQFTIDSIASSSLFITSIKDNVKIRLHQNLLNDFYIFTSKRLTRDSQQLIGEKIYCNVDNSNIYNKIYTIVSVSSIDLFVFFNGNIKIYCTTKPFLGNCPCLRTKEQYVKDSLLKQLYNTRHEISYAVTPDLKFDEKKFGYITNYNQTGKVSILARAHSCRIGQSIYHGKIEETSHIDAGKYIVIAGADTILDKIYYKAIDCGKVFYIDANNVDFTWDSYSYYSGDYHYDERPYIAKLLSSPKDIQDAYFEYVKSYYYELYLNDLKTIKKHINQWEKHGILMKKCKPYRDYYSTGIEFEVINYSKKVIKYIELTTTAINSVGDPISTKTVKGVGPIDPGETGYYDFENVWYDKTISTHKPKSIIITYMDNSKSTIKSNDIDKLRTDIEYESALQDVISYPSLKCSVYDKQNSTLTDYPQP